MRRALAALCALPLLGGCVAAAIGAGAVWTTNEFTENATLAFLEEEPEVVWRVARESVQRRSLDPIEVREGELALRANVDGATVTVQVRRYDATQTRLAVSAKKWGFYDADEANTIITLIKRNLDR